jgi:hypothetical protein
LGELHAAHEPESSAHSKVAPLVFELKAKLAEVEVVLEAGFELMDVSSVWAGSQIPS